MKIKLSFLGAARNVTGSRYLLEAGDTRVLVDCGLYQERDFTDRNWAPFPVPPETIDAVLLTHAHLDHCGLIPKLVREGFRGKIYGTAATTEISQIILLDSAHLQEEDAAFKKRRHERENRRGPFPERPLYTVEDAREAIPLFSPVNYGETVRINDIVKAIFREAGHVLGSSVIRVEVKLGGETRTLVFSGDVGRWNRPILRDPSVLQQVDYLLVESTYGDRLHPATEDIADSLAEIINSTHRAGGNIVVPSFALERSQEVLYYMNQLLMEDRIPHLWVFLDSPMAIKITEVFKRHPELFDAEMSALVVRNKSPLDFPDLMLTETTEQSKAINHIKGTVMIIAGSGMCTGGRIKHHLVSNITRPESTVLFIGYQAFGTPGRQIVEGAGKIRLLGQYYPVKARVEQIHGFSSHADRNELLRWLSHLRTAPRRVFVVHGEAEAAVRFGKFLNEQTGWPVSVPDYEETVFLD